MIVDIVAVIVLIIALISAIAFNSGNSSAPQEWNPLLILFQDVLGWSLFQTTVFCFGIWYLAVMVFVSWGNAVGYTDKENNPYLARKVADLIWFSKAALISVVILSVLAWVVGMIFG